MTAALTSPDEVVRPARPEPVPALGEWSAFYEAHFDAVWRGLRRLGVAEASLDDAAQEVFLIAFRRIGSFEGRSTLKTWLFGIALLVARRFHHARGAHGEAELLDSLPDLDAKGPQESLAQAEAVRHLYEILAQLDADKRAVFVMAELEEMTAPEIAHVTQAPLNTVYSRLRAARRDFEAALKRLRAQERWRTP